MQSNNTKVFAQTKWGRRVVGIVSGRTYEKKLKSTGILHSPPAIALSVDELRQAERAGAEFLRVQATDTGETYAIDLDLFRHFGFQVSRGYGEQLACELHHFGRSSRIADRNPITDNPRLGKGKEYQRPLVQQLPLFRR